MSGLKEEKKAGVARGLKAALFQHLCFLTCPAARGIGRGALTKEQNMLISEDKPATGAGCRCQDAILS